MKAIVRSSLLVLAFGLGVSAAQAADNAKPITQTTCADYLALDESVQPKFIYYAVGHSQNGDPEAVFNMAGVDTIHPQLNEFCEINLTKSAYLQVMKSSMASEIAYDKENK